MKRLLDRYFLSRIDRALDDGVPLAGLTAWYVKRNENLTEYYRSMLRMELELRFSDFENSSDKVEKILPAWNRSGKSSKIEHRSRRLVPILCIALAVGVFFCMNRFPFDRKNARDRHVDHFERKIDLGELWTSPAPFSTSEPSLNGQWSVLNKIPSANSPVASIVGFSEKPLDTTLDLFESVHTQWTNLSGTKTANRRSH